MANSMKRILLIISCLLFTITTFSQSILVVNNGNSYKYDTKSSTGLNMGCYVVPETSPLVFVFTSEKAEPMNLYSFGTLGDTYKNKITTALQQGKTLTFTGGDKDCGYIIEQGVDVYRFWVSAYKPVSSLECDYSYTNICDNARIVGEGLTILYYTKDGVPRTIPRKVKYNTWLWNEEEESLETSVEVEVIGEPSIDDKLVIESPFETTYITIVDDIPNAWGEPIKEVSTDEEYTPKAIFMEAVVTQIEREATNEIFEDVEGEAYGGSAPVEMEFEAFVNEGNYFCWQFFKSAIGPEDESPVIYATYLDQTLNYTFKDAGTTYVRLHAENGVCSKDITYTIIVNDSFIDAPNAFSPGVSPGVNDEWKVAYKSIVEFKCAIFDRWGVKMFDFNDPSIGWDGKYKGKYVPSGVYYYVIQAKGSDNKDYKLKGHINILRGKDTYEE